MSLDTSLDLSGMSVESLARKLKHYWTNIYIISPVELATFVKIKSNLLRQGIVLEESVLNSSVVVIINWLNRKLNKTPDLAFGNNKITPTSENLGSLLDTDIASIEMERQEIRRQLFKENIKLRIRQSVKNFSIQCNKKMSVWDIRIPSSWDVSMEQSFLLSLYDKTFHKKNTVESEETAIPIETIDSKSKISNKKTGKEQNDTLINFINSIIEKHNDFALMRADLDLFLTEHVDLSTLELGDDVFGDNLPLSSIMILRVLSDRIIDSSMTKNTAFEKIGLRRKRLVTKLEDFVSARKK